MTIREMLEKNDDLHNGLYKVMNTVESLQVAAEEIIDDYPTEADETVRCRLENVTCQLTEVYELLLEATNIMEGEYDE